jgi:DNA (cytosine-5)-methyltransferase 1
VSRRKASYLTVTDLFCGAGGSSIGARDAGLEVRMAANHWERAVETHWTNFPETDHDCVDISASDPRRYPSTDFLWASPECTTHSPAGGNRRRPKRQRDLFIPHFGDPSVERSRVTATDVIRYAEYHRYEIIIIENVVEFATQWDLFTWWLDGFTKMGYRWKLVSLNSMFCHPTPQSRDRLYIVFWKKGNRAPDLDIRPHAFCPRCERDVEAVQTWKAGALARAHQFGGQPVGKYRQQYVYTCPKDGVTVTPYYFAALNAIDFSIPAERIGDRRKALAPRTMDRIRYGLEKFGRRALVVNVKQGERDRSRAWPADVRELGTIPTWDGTFALAHPDLFFVGGHLSRPVSPPEAPLGTLSAARVHAALVTMRTNMRARGVDEAMPVLCAHANHHGLMFSPIVIGNRTNNVAKGCEDPFPAFVTGTTHMVVQGAALINLRDTLMPYGFDDPLHTQTAKGPVDAIIARSPIVLSYYGKRGVHAGDAPMSTHTARDRHGLVWPVEIPDAELPSIEDCYFRMVVPAEMHRGMAFPEGYIVTGNQTEQVRQYGNAVTPPVPKLLIPRAVASLHSERAA